MSGLMSLGLFFAAGISLLAGFPVLLWIATANIGPAQRWKNVAALLIGGLLILAPVTLRNLIVADDFVLLTSNGGVNLLIGQQHEQIVRGGRRGDVRRGVAHGDPGVIVEAHLRH